MGLDIYAGTMTRYYSRNWKTIVQQLAEANGHKCELIGNDGNEIKPLEDQAQISEIRDTICDWAEKLASALESFDTPVTHPLWDETNEGDYFTDKPDWEAFGALVMLQACHIQNCPLPEYVESGWSAFDEPVVKKSMSQKSGVSLLSNVGHWLPIDDNAMFKVNLPNGDEARVATLKLLKNELDELNRQICKADEQTIHSWRDDKYYIPVKQKKSKSISGILFRKKPRKRYRTEELAQSAFSILYQAVNFAIENQVSLLLDY